LGLITIDDLEAAIAGAGSAWPHLNPALPPGEVFVSREAPAVHCVDLLKAPGEQNLICPVL